MPDTDPPADAGALAPFSRGFAAAVDDVDAARRWVVSKINTDAVDRFDTVVSPAGMDRTDYLKNPVVLWAHGQDPARGQVPIGRNAWIKPRGASEVIAKTVFADDEFSRGLLALYRDGFLSGWSINGKPTSAGPPTAAEKAARPELIRCKLIYRAWRLTEYSGTPLPGNGDCMTEEVSRSIRGALARGLWVPDSVLAGLPPLEPARAGDPDRDRAELIRTLPPLAVVRTLDDAAAEVVRRSQALARSELTRALQEAQDLARGRI